MAKKNQLLKVLITVLLLIVIFIFYQYNRTVPIISLSVSTDGRYVISAHATEDADRHKPIGQLVLWDIEKKEKTILARNANAFSAFFIPDSHEFMWQDNKNIVHIQNVEGKEIENFPHFQVKTHIMSEINNFIFPPIWKITGSFIRDMEKILCLFIPMEVSLSL